MTTLLLFLLATAVAALPCDGLSESLTTLEDLHLACATTALRPALREAATCRPRPETHGTPRAADKLVRDATGTYNSSHETENFAIKWGPSQSFSQADVEALADAFELAWDVEIVDLGYPVPVDAETYKFNVYIGDTGQGVPSSYGNAGYFYLDDAGWPIIVVGAAGLPSHDEAAATAAHEFFHAVQDAIGTYAYDDRSAWYAEATAMWIESQVFPNSGAFLSFANWFAIRPELALNHFDYPSGAFTPEQLHHYGAVVFVKHLEENYGGTEIVRRSLIEAPVQGDPMLVIDDLLEESGEDLVEVFFDCVGRNATWDYRYGDWYGWWVEAYGGWAQDGSHRPSGRVYSETDGFQTGVAPLPHTYGANYWELRDLPDDVRVSFDGDDGAARWYAAVATKTGSVHHRAVLTLDGSGAGELEVSDLADVDEAWLVIAAVDSIRDQGDTFGYTFVIEEAEGEEPLDDTGDEEQPKACGCGLGGPALPGFVLPAVFLWFGRRRRARPDPHSAGL